MYAQAGTYDRHYMYHLAGEIPPEGDKAAALSIGAVGALAVATKLEGYKRGQTKR
jgi:hypothetical protein